MGAAEQEGAACRSTQVEIKHNDHTAYRCGCALLPTAFGFASAKGRNEKGLFKNTYVNKVCQYRYNLPDK